MRSEKGVEGRGPRGIIWRWPSRSLSQSPLPRAVRMPLGLQSPTVTWRPTNISSAFISPRRQPRSAPPYTRPSHAPCSHSKTACVAEIAPFSGPLPEQVPHGCRCGQSCQGMRGQHELNLNCFHHSLRQMRCFHTSTIPSNRLEGRYGPALSRLLVDSRRRSTVPLPF